eukprot:g4854.t1
MAASAGRPFPRRSVIILALALTTNAYTLVNLFPYVGMMVKHLMNLPTTNESGYYAGYIASSFTFGRFLTAYVWGHASDSIGRKPVVLIGLSAIVVCSVAFGLSTSFTMAIASRFVLGLLNGIMPAVRAMTREVCGPEHVVMGMNYIGGSRGVGLVIGTAVGGLLAQPAILYPGTFSATGLFGRYPFLLPNLFGASVALLMLPLVFFCLPETRTRAKDARNDGRSKTSSEASPDRDMVPMGRARRSGKGAGGQLAYKPLEDDHDVEGDEEVPQRSLSGPHGSGLAPSPINRNCGNGEIRRAGSGCPAAGMVELGPAKSSSKKNNTRYELLHDGDCDGVGDVRETETSGKVAGGSSAAVGRGTPTGDRNDSGGGDGEEDGDPRMPGQRGLLSTPNVKMILFIVAIVQMASIGFEEAFPLFALSTTDVGGLGWGTEQIGKVLGLTGIILVVLQLGLFPPLIKYVGIVKWQRAGCLLAVPIFLAVPNARFLSWNESSLFAVNVVNNILINCSFGSAMLALTVASTTIVPQHQRGKLSGLFMTSESLGRFTGPASFSNVYAWSISPSAPGWVDHRFVFFLPAAIMAAVLALGWHTFTAETLSKSPRPPPLAASETRGGRGGGGSAAVAGDDAAATEARGSAREAFVGSDSGAAAARHDGVSPAAEGLPRLHHQRHRHGALDAAV